MNLVMYLEAIHFADFTWKKQQKKKVVYYNMNYNMN